MLFFVLAHVASAAAPVAEAGSGLLAYVDDTVVLDGSGSYDDDKDVLTFAWSQAGGPPVKLDDDTADTPRFTVEDVGTYRFQLIVNDGAEDSEPDTVEIVVPYETIGENLGCATSGVSGNPAWFLGVLVGVGRISRLRRAA